MSFKNQNAPAAGHWPSKAGTELSWQQRDLHKSLERDIQAMFALRGGHVLIVFKSTKDVREGDSVELYAGDYFISAGIVERQGDGPELTCKAPIDHAPSIMFPASVRAILTRLNQEILPGLTITNVIDLQKNMERHGLNLHLRYVLHNSMGFHVEVDCLPVFPRSLTLNLDGHFQSTALTEIPKYDEMPDSLKHQVAFPLQTPLREGMSIEILDDATGKIVYQTALTWLNLINPLLDELHTTHDRQAALAEKLERMRQQLLASVDPSRERLLLQRLDLTYLLLNERLDREIQWLASRIEQADGHKSLPEHFAERVNSTTYISPSGLQGAGIYDSESNGVDAWRWFSRMVTLFLTEVSPIARTLRIHFNTATFDLDLSQMNVSVNGYDSSFEWAYPEGKMDLLVGLSSLSSRPDKTLIVTIDFGQAWNAENDDRMLTYACIGVHIDA